MHSYENPGTYQVTLKVTNSCKCTSTTTTEVIIEEEGFDISCASVVCEKQIVTYSLPEVANNYCGGFAWQVEGGTIVGDDSANTVNVSWDNINENGFGFVTFLPTDCDLPCLLPTTIRIPVIQVEGTIQGNTSLCLGSQGRYSLPQWPTTNFEWEILGNTGGQLGTLMQTDQRNEIVFTPTQAGQVTLFVKYYNTLIHCGGTAQIVIDVKSPEPFTGETTICLGTNSIYNTVSTNAVKWTLRNSTGSIISSPVALSNTFNYTFINPGNYTLNVSGVGICTGQTKSITVAPALDAPTLDSPELTVCPNAPYTYTIENPDPNSEYLWEITNGLFTSTNSTTATGVEVNVTFQGSGQIKVKRQQISPVQCSSPFLVQAISAVSINAAISDNTQPNPLIVACANNYFTYNAINTSGGIYSDPDSNYVWSILPNTAGSISSGQGSNTVEVLWNNVASQQAYTLQVVITKCTAVQTVTKTVQVTPVPSITIDAISSVCSGVSISFEIDSSTSLATGTQVLWNFGNGQTQTALATATVSRIYNNGSGVNNNYTITATIINPNACPGTITASHNIVVTPGPNASASNPTGVNAFCTAGEVNVTLQAATTGSASIVWYKNTLSNPVGAGGSLNIGPTLNFGTYFFVATLNGCTTRSNSIVIFNNCNEPSLCTISGNPTTEISWTNACGIVTLTGNATGNSISKRWTIIGPGINISNVSSNNGPNQYVFSALEAGQFTVLFSTTYLGTNGQPCTITTSRIVTVPYIPNFKISATCGAVVNNSSTYNVTLTDDSNFLTSITNKMWQYEYRTLPSGTWQMWQPFSTTPNFSINGFPSGTYEVRQSIKGSSGSTPGAVCVKIYTMTLMDMESLSIAFTQPTCFDTSVDFSVPNTESDFGDTYLWTFDNTTVTNTNETPTRVFNSGLAGTLGFPISVKITNKYGCFKILTANVNIPLKCFTGDVISDPQDATVCKGESVELSYSSPNGLDDCTIISYVWMKNNEVILNATASTYLATTPGFYTLKVSSGFCEYLCPSVITPVFKNLPTLTLYGPGTLCEGEDATFSITSNATQITWMLDGAIDLSSQNQDSFTIPNLPLGVHTINVGVTSADGCYKTAEQIIEVIAPASVVTIGSPALDDCQTYTITLTATASGTGTYNWSNGGSGDTITVTEGGAYMVTFTNEGGCSTSAQVYVPKNPKAYMWVFPTGCYSKCKDEEAYLLGPTLPINSWNWLWDNNIDSSGTGTFPSNYPLTETGEYNLQLNTGLCDFTSPTMNLTASDCEGCELEPQVIEVEFLDNGICASQVTIEIHSGYGFDIQASLVGNNSNLIISPSSFTIVPGYNLFTFTLIPINGYGGGFTTLSLLGSYIEEGMVMNCANGLEVDLKNCSPTQARPIANSDQPKENLSVKNDIVLFPNPAQNQVNIRFETQQKDSQVEVYDLTGRLIASYNATQTQGVWELDLAPMATGVYVVVLRQGNQILMQRKLQVL